MQNRNHFFVNPFKACTALAVFLFLTVISVCLVTIREYIGAAVFFVVGLLFVPPILQYGRVVTTDSNGVSAAFLGRIMLKFSWNELAEVGVAGSRVFGSRDGKKPGTLYLYFSPSVMTEKEKFDMILKFPPKDKIVLICDTYSYGAVRKYWHGTIKNYNAKDTPFD